MLCKICVRISTDTKLQLKVTLKRLCQEINIFLKAYDNKKVLSLHALIVLVIKKFFLVDEKNKTESFSLRLWNNFLILRNLSRFKDPIKRPNLH